jgi:hypothetical protein
MFGWRMEEEGRSEIGVCHAPSEFTLTKLNPNSVEHGQPGLLRIDYGNSCKKKL